MRTAAAFGRTTVTYTACTAMVTMMNANRL
jgi:hypothetical protein